ncbi:D-aminoacyl-tRNA deacylase-like [Lineus longissimus]|uniref:D-aminoacyl-tRNA deacylase-like n=1 Tax=Lineus longissimus TaxID=88925 RepID=UPI002B4E1ED8
MRAVIQRVTKASVTVGEELVSSIEKGLCVLMGISRYDKPCEVEYMVRKILNLRVFEDDEGKRWAKSVKDRELEILCVSQFTLQSILKGNKPDFHGAMEADLSQQMYEEFLKQMRGGYSPDKIKDGRFGAYMQVHIQNDGPVTIQLESPLQAKGLVETGKEGKDKTKGNKQNEKLNKQTKSKAVDSGSSHDSAANRTDSCGVSEVTEKIKDLES